MQESSRVSIEVVEHYGDGVYLTHRSEHGHTGSIEIGRDIASSLAECGRPLVELAAAAVELFDDEDYQAYTQFPDETAFVEEARKLIAAWEKIDAVRDAKLENPHDHPCKAPE